MTKDRVKGDSPTLRRATMALVENRPLADGELAVTATGVEQRLESELDRLQLALDRLTLGVEERIERDRLKILNSNLALHRVETELNHRNEVNVKLADQINQFIMKLSASGEREESGTIPPDPHSEVD
ncbi:MAG: hypothetical protein QM523_06195 [Candidatus Pacebacteria bacterium]|nr:hypothetical protein [Candidatus Paceibacterota bacterium]